MGLLDAGQLSPAPNGVVCHIFSLSALAASQSALQASRDIGQFGVQMPFRGSILGLGFSSSLAKTDGTATFEVFVDAEATGARLDWDTGASMDIENWADGTYPFTPSEVADIRATTDDSFLPVTANIELMLYVTYVPS